MLNDFISQHGVQLKAVTVEKLPGAHRTGTPELYSRECVGLLARAEVEYG